MDDLKEPVARAAQPGARPRRSRLRVLLYVLAGAVLLALVVVGTAAYRGTPRVAIDEATVIDSVMAATYGSYSTEKKGWLYTGDDNVTYLMRVVQQEKITDGADGDELYFVASGAAVDGSEHAVYGAFHLHPARPWDGNLAQASLQVKYESTLAVRPEQVRFLALGANLRGWIVRAQSGTDPAQAPVTTTNTVLAPHGGEIAVLGEFLAARTARPAVSCEAAKAAWETWNRDTTPDADNAADNAAANDAANHAAPDDTEEEEEEEPLRCEQRSWSYRLAASDGMLPAPITVTAGGTLDGRPVEAHTWALTFDPKRFGYAIPRELRDE
ncbi:hypothetical protein QPK32_18675 [Massilia sp. YIM B02763]|uniref:hypothetical protein n=1 Tax=Massilia sp. YIM B02763 TaxID=3050130 RepID=UPI0025B633B7|nr:hypothetical protein [Massilia sp. YIM B02763]MDN4055101.1 hypothetical protein [Massilia sp. YIM B02763]